MRLPNCTAAVQLGLYTSSCERLPMRSSTVNVERPNAGGLISTCVPSGTVFIATMPSRTCSPLAVIVPLEHGL